MSEKHKDIVKAAARMFSRYGLSKTTMSDIASEAGVARQTVYNAFSGKTEILRAVVRFMGEETQAEIENAWTERNSLNEKLSLFQEIGPVKWYLTVREAPDWAELLEGVHEAASRELETLYEEQKSALTDMVSKECPNFAHPDIYLPDVVEMFHSASVNAKYGADDVDALRRRLNTTKLATLALLKSSDKGSK